MVLATATASQVSAATAYVDQNSPDPTPPYSTLATAAHHIQDAVDVTTNGDTVLVEPGQYNLTNQVIITNAITLRSAMGTNQTILNVEIGTWGLSVSNAGALVDGFTIQGDEQATIPPRGIFLVGGTVQNCSLPNFLVGWPGTAIYMVGGTLSNSVVPNYHRFGGTNGSAVYCSNGGLVANCQILGGPNAEEFGIGVYLLHSQLRNSLIWGAPGPWSGAALAAYESTIVNCTITHNYNTTPGGGAYLENCLMDRCVVDYNSCRQNGGFVGGGGIFESNSVVRDSVIANNNDQTLLDLPPGGVGGGVFMRGGALVNCTVSENEAFQCTNNGTGPGYGAGVYVESGGLTNCIIYSNFHNGCSTDEDDWFNAGPGVFDHCCTTPDPGGTGNITQDPQFVDPTNGDFHLKSTSPCIDAGVVQPWMAGAEDLDGKPRTVNGTVDMGAYEHPAVSPQPVAILNPHWQNGNFSLSFLTQTNDAYYVQYTDSLAPASWHTLTSFVGNGAMMGATNQNAAAAVGFYRVVAQ